MILYYCPECGHWQPPSFADGLKLGFAESGLQGVPAETQRIALSAAITTKYVCPSGHGAMVQVLSSDCISVRDAEPVTGPRLRAVKPEVEVQDGQSS